MTKQCIKILIKADSMNESVLPKPLPARCARHPPLRQGWARALRAELPTGQVNLESLTYSPLNQPALRAELVRFLHRNRKSGSYASMACPLSEHLTA